MAKNNKSNSKKETNLAVINGQQFAILKAGIGGLQESLKENIGDEGLTPFDLDRIRIPAGGSNAWSIPGIGEDEVVTSFTGVIIFHKMGRVYWEAAFGEGGGSTPPNCSSDESQVGIGTPGGNCLKCPLAEFGSAKSGNKKGQACKQIKMFFVMRPKGLLPVCVSLPPTSLRPAKKYMLRLASFSWPYYAILTKFELEQTANSEGIKYSKVKLSIAKDLSPQQAEQFKKLSHKLRPHLEAVQVQASDLPESEDKT